MLCREGGLHEFNVFDMGEAGHVVKVGWIGMSTNSLMYLKGCPTAKFPSIEDKGGSNGSKTLEGLGQ